MESKGLNLIQDLSQQDISPRSSSSSSFVDTNFSKDTWKNLGVSNELIDYLVLKGFKTPAIIQSETFKILKSYPDSAALIQAKNGSGKTLSFVIPILECIDPKLTYTPKIDIKGIRKLLVYMPQAVIIVHNRELANQIEKVISRLITNEERKRIYKDIRLCLIKAEDYSDIQKGGQILITTPGVLKNLSGIKSTIERINSATGEKELLNITIDLNQCRFFVIDEADEVYNIEAHANAITSLVSKIPKQTPIYLFSATMSNNLKFSFEKNFQNRNPVKKIMEKETLTVKTIKQKYLDMEESNKIKALIAIFDRLDISCQSVIFVNTKKFADELQKQFKEGEVDAFVLHKDLGTEQRDKAINDFLNRKFKILITTNILSRGIDNRAVNFVINAELPLKRLEDGTYGIDYTTYLHRVGRTGRFDLEGLALNIVTNDLEKKYIKDIEKYFDVEITPIEKLSDIDEILKEIEHFNVTLYKPDSKN